MIAESLIADARGFASSLVSDASRAMASAVQSVQQVGYISPNPAVVVIPIAPVENLGLVAPVLSPVDMVQVTPPTPPVTFQDIPVVDTSGLPLLSSTPPTITLPTSPSQLAGFNETAPTISTNIIFPEPPSALMAPLFDAPVLPIRTEPDKPQTMIPSFTVSAPTGMPDAPTALADTFDAAYRNAAPSTITMLNGFVDAQMAKYNPRRRHSGLNYQSPNNFERKLQQTTTNTENQIIHQLQ